MFRLPNAADCLLVDFQIATYHALTIDAMICIWLPPSGHLNAVECMQFYYNQLALELQPFDIALGSIMPWNDFVVGCKQAQPLVLLMQPLLWSLTHLPDGFLHALLASNEAEYIKICREDRAPVMLDFIDSNAFYRDTMMESIERLIEHLFVDEIGGVH